MTTRNQKGFTLIELLIVIVIIGILAGIVITILNPVKQQNRARDGVIVATMNKISADVKSYGNSDISGTGTLPTCAQLVGTTAGTCTNGSLQNIATCPCAQAAGSADFTINGVGTGSTVLTGQGTAYTGFQYRTAGAAPTQTFCISAVANEQSSGSSYIKYDTATGTTPTRTTTSCF